MRYEHLRLDLSTAALDELRLLLAPQAAVFLKGGTSGTPAPVHLELMGLFNEIEARLQRRDQDPRATLHSTGLKDYPLKCVHADKTVFLCPVCDPNGDLIS